MSQKATKLIFTNQLEKSHLLYSQIAENALRFKFGRTKENTIIQFFATHWQINIFEDPISHKTSQNEIFKSPQSTELKSLSVFWNPKNSSWFYQYHSPPVENCLDFFKSNFIQVSKIRDITNEFMALTQSPPFKASFSLQNYSPLCLSFYFRDQIVSINGQTSERLCLNIKHPLKDYLQSNFSQHPNGLKRLLEVS